MPLPANQISASMQTAAIPTHPNGAMYAGVYTLIFRIRRRRDRRVLHEHRLIQMPMRLTQTTETRTAVYYTKAGAVADLPLASGVGMTHFSITGHTGIAGIRNRTLAPTGTTSEAFDPSAYGLVLPTSSIIDGAAAVKDLQDMVLHYFFPQGGTPLEGVTRTQELQLEFLNLSAPTSAQDRVGRVGWIIHPSRNMVDIAQEAPRPFLYTYTLQFPALAPLNEAVPDRFVAAFTAPTPGLQQTQQQLDAAAKTEPPKPPVPGVGKTFTGFPRQLVLPVAPLVALLKQCTTAVLQATERLNTIRTTAKQLLADNYLKPAATFVAAVRELGSAVKGFVDEVAATIRFPLYARTQILELRKQLSPALVTDVASYSVTTLKAAALDLSRLFVLAAEPRSVSKLNAGTTLTAGTNDRLTLKLNSEAPRTLTLGTQPSGEAIAAAIQSQVRAFTPEHSANASAYRDFTATYAGGQYTLASGTKLSDAGRVEVVVNPDSALTPGDASPVLGLGAVNGGQEHAGSSLAAEAIHLLRGIEEACTHLQAFPDYFADQLETQDAVLAGLLPEGLSRPQIHGDQRLEQTRITPGDSLQGIAARVGSDWQTLALVNRLTYPYILEEPTTLARGRVSSATAWSLQDAVQAWAVDAFQGQRVDIVYGTGAGQSRRILRNTATALVLETAWEVVPMDTSDYAIRSATNPIVQTGAVSSADTRTLTDAGLELVPGSQRGLTLVVTSGGAAGERRRISGHDTTTYTVDPPWEVAPPPGSLYLILGPSPATFRQKVVGEWLSVPQPSAETVLPIRSRLHDVSAITGQSPSTEDQLFGRDALLEAGALRYDPAQADLVTIAGLPNLRQALIHYVNLPIGELEYAPEIGSYVQESLGLTASLPLQIELLASVERTVTQDARIATMGSADVRTSGGAVQIAFAATAVNGASVERIVVR
jgi:LysM domain